LLELEVKRVKGRRGWRLEGERGRGEGEEVGRRSEEVMG